ncbi:MAG: alpha-glucosidase [Acidobacteriota bacterium]
MRLQRLMLGLVMAMLMAAGGAKAQGAVNGAAPSSDPTWWKHAVVYEIYPRSFMDSNGDGMGDLKGIASRMDYLEKLGVDAIWIAPMYPSPQVDFGYDISNYEAVDPQYGTMADFDKLLAAGKAHHVRVILDMVLNHTSDKHKWFEEAASSRTSPKHDWYVWSDGKPGTGPGSHEGRVPPNNWVSMFGGSAWEWVPGVKQFYYHQFYKQQPDLNWRNPKVEKEMFGEMQFWLNKGVAGFRLDAIDQLYEDTQLRDEPERGGVDAQGDKILNTEYTTALPEVHDVLRRMRAMVAKYPGDRVLIGETYTMDTAELDKWYGGAAKDELQLPMDMVVAFTGGNMETSALRRSLEAVETGVQGSQPLLVFDNHDNVRSWDRFGDGVHNLEIAKAVAALLLTNRATALTYYGAEIGMVTSTPTRKEDVKDPIGITGWPKEKGRDGERTPMQWTAGKDAGFSTAAKTWLPIPESYKTVNVQAETGDKESMLEWHRKLIALRRTVPALHDGGEVMIDRGNKAVLEFVRTGPEGKGSVVVAINISAEVQEISPDVSEAGVKAESVKTLVTDVKELEGVTSLKKITLPAFAVWVGTLE